MKKIIIVAIILASFVGCTKLSNDGDDTNTLKEEKVQTDSTLRKGINIIKMKPAPIYA